MDSFDRFEETELPSQDAFFSKLPGSPCSDHRLHSIHMQHKCEISLDVRRLQIITISICSWMCCF